eukprot:8405237-Pyramimonas_sp.AAC.1
MSGSLAAPSHTGDSTVILASEGFLSFHDSHTGHALRVPVTDAGGAEAFVEEIVDASRIPTNPSRNDAHES